MVNARSPQNINKVPFKQVLQLKLADQMKGFRKESQSGPICLGELSILLACFKSSNFKDQACSAEIKKFYDCYNSEKEKAKKNATQSKKLTTDAANKLLKKFPNI